MEEKTIKELTEQDDPIMWNQQKQCLTLGELRRVVAVTKVIPLALSYTGSFHSASTAGLQDEN